MESIEAATRDLEKAKALKENFERELSRAVLHNSGTLSVWGKCHLSLGHTRPNCDGDDCTAVMLCGMVDKHPIEQATRRDPTRYLQNDYQNKFQAHKSV